jgi:hypothetical protein
MTNQEILQLAIYQGNWQRLRAYSQTSNNYTYAQLKRLFHQRESTKYGGLNHCFKLVGKTGYINEPLFGAWMAGLLTDNIDGAQS